MKNSNSLADQLNPDENLSPLNQANDNASPNHDAPYHLLTPYTNGNSSEAKNNGTAVSPLLIETFLQELEKKIAKRTHRIGLTLESIYSISLILFTINATRCFPGIRRDLYEAISNNLYLACEMPEPFRQAAATGGATGTVEAFGLITATATILSFSTAYLAFSQLCKSLYYYPKVKKIISANRQTHAKKLTALHNFELNNYTINILTDFGFTKEALEFIPKKRSQWHILTEIIRDHNKETSKYSIPIATIAGTIGLTIMLNEIHKINQLTGCDFWDLFTDQCPVVGRYDMYATETYPWLAISATSAWLYTISNSVKLLSLVKYQGERNALKLAASIFVPFKRLADWFYQAIHVKYEKAFKLRQEDSDWWIYHDLLWDITFIPIMAGVLIYASTKAFMTADEYEKEINCPSFLNYLGLIAAGKISDDPGCTSSQMIGSVLGFVGDSEINKDYPSYLIAKVLTYGAAFLALGCLRKKIPLARAKELHNKHMNIFNYSKIAGLLGCVSTGLYWVYASSVQANEPLRNGIEVIQKWDDTYQDLIPANFTEIFNNHTFDDLLRQKCPYATNMLMTYLNDTIYGNADLPIYRMIDNSTVAYPLSANCSYNIFSLCLASLLGTVKDCPPLTYNRAVDIFSGSYWLEISVSTAVPFILVATTLYLWWIKLACKKEQQTLREIEFSDRSKDRQNIYTKNRHLLFHSSANIDINNEEKNSTQQLNEPLLVTHANGDLLEEEEMKSEAPGCLTRLFSRIKPYITLYSTSNQQNISYKTTTIAKP